MHIKVDSTVVVPESIQTYGLILEKVGSRVELGQCNEGIVVQGEER